MSVQSNVMIYAITSQKTQYFGDTDFYMAECSNREYNIIVACPDKSSFIVQFNDDVGRLGIAIGIAHVLFFRFSLIALVILYVNLADTSVYKLI